ncbi:MAG: hypothetical protein KDI48_12435, partial [Xanthomonadales bacterium]|nr:hypothetical protein [Xanthomonadales bacterium]
STDAANPSRLDAETADESFAETTAAFSIEAVSSRDQNAPNVVIRRYFDDLVMNEVRIFNNYGLGVLTAIAMDRYPIFTPQVIWPGGLFIEDLRGPLYAALVSQPTNPGQRLIQEEISLTQVELLESSTLIVSGSIWTGYALEVE